MQHIHILNGDASLPAFEAAALEGQVLVWREILADGPAPALPFEEFWKKRQEYICHTYRETEAGYSSKVLRVLEQLKAVKTPATVTLWFDTDLVCQVNQLYLLQWLPEVLPAGSVIRISGHTDGEVPFMPPQQLRRLHQEAQDLPQATIELAREIWQCYSSPDPILLQEVLSKDWLELTYAKPAFQKHLQRFPSCSNGLNNLEQQLLLQVRSGIGDLQELMQHFWQQEPLYGFGDWQLQRILQNLSPELVQLEEQRVSLTATGEQVLDQQRKQQEVKPFDGWIGGVYLTGKDPGWCWSDSSKNLISS
jgi:hypothetical protein